LGEWQLVEIRVRWTLGGGKFYLTWQCACSCACSPMRAWPGVPPRPAGAPVAWKAIWTCAGIRPGRPRLQGLGRGRAQDAWGRGSPKACRSDRDAAEALPEDLLPLKVAVREDRFRRGLQTQLKNASGTSSCNARCEDTLVRRAISFASSQHAS